MPESPKILFFIAVLILFSARSSVDLFAAETDKTSSAITASPSISLPSFISNGMVLQRGVEVPLWGDCYNTEKIKVSFREFSLKTDCTADNQWRVVIPSMTPGGPWPLTIDYDQNETVLQDIYVGDVWVAAGQSNMRIESDFSAVDLGTSIIQAFQFTHDFPDDRSTYWKNLNEMGLFSKVAGYFGKGIAESERIPIGIIAVPWGGTDLNCWQEGGTCYDVQITPFIQFAIKGIIWWQGEADAIDYCGESPNDYGAHFATLIETYRRAWGESDLPFLYVQLERYTPKPQTFEYDVQGEQCGYESWAKVREAQREALSIPNTAMVVSFDLTDGDMHPSNTEPIGKRLALAARGLVYGEDVVFGGPSFLNAQQESNNIRINFSKAVRELVYTSGSPIQDFELVDQKGVSHKVGARIQDGSIIIPMNGLSVPSAVRYGYKVYPQGNLVGETGLPASPFVSALQISEVDRTAGCQLITH